MSLDFRDRSVRRYGKCQPREQIKKFDGEHLSTSRLLSRHKYNYSYTKANMRRWLHKRVGRPIDKVYSEFLKTWNRSSSKVFSPKEYFYSYIDSKDCKNPFIPVFYVSNGILCAKKLTRHELYYIPPYEKNWGKKQIEYNKAHCPKLDTLKDGPVFLGKLWARTSGYTRLVNVWMISNVKLGKEFSEAYKHYRTDKRLHSFLKDFTEVTLAGIAPYVATYTVWDSTYSKKYSFIAKLSDIKQ